MAIDQILPTSIIINYGGIDNIEIKSDKDADRSLQDLASMIETITHLSVHVIVIFEDAFIWSSNIVLVTGDCISDNFLQRAMQSEWEFNAGVRPNWWPPGIESDAKIGITAGANWHGADWTATICGQLSETFCQRATCPTDVALSAAI